MSHPWLSLKLETSNNPGKYGIPGTASLFSQSSNESRIIRDRVDIVTVTLSPEQAKVLGPLIDTHREATGVTGLLGAITRSYSTEAGSVTLELQLTPLTRRIAAAVAKAAKL